MGDLSDTVAEDRFHQYVFLKNIGLVIHGILKKIYRIAAENDSSFHGSVRSEDISISWYPFFVLLEYL